MISLIIPVGARSPFLEHCLQGLKLSTYQLIEVILVFDGWKGKEITALDYPFAIKTVTIEQAGPARCRNFGAKLAQNDVLLFLDADVVVHKESIARALESMQSKNADAIIGSYDDEPGQKDSVSQFRNLLHHYQHQQHNGQKGVFWGAFGMIKKSVFNNIGGFNENFTEPSVEDIELGYRLQDKGYVAILDASILLKHLKKWTLVNMIFTDTFKRAMPWTVLLTKHNNWAKNKLNTTTSEKVSAILALLNILFLFLGLWHVYMLFAALVFLLAFMFIQWPFYTFLAQKCTNRCLLSSIVLHHIYYLSAIAGFFFAQIKINLTNRS